MLAAFPYVTGRLADQRVLGRSSVGPAFLIAVFTVFIDPVESLSNLLWQLILWKNRLPRYRLLTPVLYHRAPESSYLRNPFGRSYMAQHACISLYVNYPWTV